MRRAFSRILFQLATFASTLVWCNPAAPSEPKQARLPDGSVMVHARTTYGDTHRVPSTGWGVDLLLPNRPGDSMVFWFKVTGSPSPTSLYLSRALVVDGRDQARVMERVWGAGGTGPPNGTQWHAWEINPAPAVGSPFRVVVVTTQPGSPDTEVEFEVSNSSEFRRGIESEQREYANSSARLSDDLARAMAFHQEGQVRSLFRAGARLEEPWRIGYTDAMWAIEDGDESLALSLITRSKNTTVKSSTGDSLLAQAARARMLRVMRYLVLAGAGVNEADDLGRTPLMYSAKSAHFAGVQLLLQHGAKPNVWDREGYTALMWAADGGAQSSARDPVTDRIKVARSLLASGASRTLTHTGESASSIARRRGRVLLARFLSHNGKSRPRAQRGSQRM